MLFPILLIDAISTSEVMKVVVMTMKGTTLMDYPPELPTLLHSSTNSSFSCMAWGKVTRSYKTLYLVAMLDICKVIRSEKNP
jgi:hypothetical protein